MVPSTSTHVRTHTHSVCVTHTYTRKHTYCVELDVHGHTYVLYAHHPALTHFADNNNSSFALRLRTHRSCEWGDEHVALTHFMRVKVIDTVDIASSVLCQVCISSLGPDQTQKKAHNREQWNGDCIVAFSCQTYNKYFWSSLLRHHRCYVCVPSHPSTSLTLRLLLIYRL